jgi:hypothetical protein
MIDFLAVQLVEIVDGDKLDPDIVEASVRDPASIGIEHPPLYTLDHMGWIRAEITTFCCPAFFHDCTFHEPRLWAQRHTLPKTVPISKA